MSEQTLTKPLSNRWIIWSWVDVPNLWGDGGCAESPFKGTVDECIDFARKAYPLYFCEEEAKEARYKATEMVGVYFWLDRKHDEIALVHESWDNGDYFDEEEKNDD